MRSVSTAATERGANFLLIYQRPPFHENRVFAFSNMAALIHYAAVFAVTMLMSLYLQFVKGLQPQLQCHHGFCIQNALRSHFLRRRGKNPVRRKVGEKKTRGLATTLSGRRWYQR